MIIRIDYQEPDVMLDLWGGTTATFTGIDRFGRVIDQRWKYYGGSPADRDRFQYGYDQDSNRQWKENPLSKALGTPVYMDEYYTYDNLNRLTVMKRGQLTGGPPPTGIAGTPTYEQDWTLDKTGNWNSFTNKVAGAANLTQTRTQNSVNEISAISQAGGNPVWIDPAYDAAGNTITLPQGGDPTLSYTGVYDAWNRLVKLSDASNTVAEYEYDGRGRRIVKLTYTGGTLTETRHVYFTNRWQDVEERTGVSTSADLQYVWGARYVDELVCRDASSTRLYALQDANYNLTALTSDTGTVLERYAYFPYGQRLIFDASWATRASSSYTWLIGHQGLLLDPESSLYYNRNRMLHPLLGRFLQRDPLGYVDGMSLYQYVRSNTIYGLDPYGTQNNPHVPPFNPTRPPVRPPVRPPPPPTPPPPTPPPPTTGPTTEPAPVPPGTPVDITATLVASILDLLGAIADAVKGKVPNVSGWKSGKCASISVSGLTNAAGNVTCVGISCGPFAAAFKSATGCDLGAKECIAAAMAANANLPSIVIDCPAPTKCCNVQHYKGQYPINASVTLNVPGLFGPPQASISATISGTVDLDGSIGDCK